MQSLLEPEAEAYLRMVFPWGTPADEQLFKVVTTISPNFREAPDPKTGKHPNIITNHGVQSWDQLANIVDRYRRSKRNRYVNVYVGLATFGKKRDDEPAYQDGSVRIFRTDWNVVSLKSLWVDVDVGPDKPYKTTGEASDALMQFLAASGLPAPTMLVFSGSGGFHVYWIFKESLPKADWQPLANALKACAAAHGFKIDPDCTADSARILRVPTTLNFKNPQAPALVEGRSVGQQALYAPADIRPALNAFIGAAPAASTSAANAPLSSTAQNFTTGVDDRVMPNVSIDDIAVNCPMTAATLADAGAGKHEPEWKQDLYLAAWTTNPTNAAHRLSNGHKDYDAADTDKKLAERQKAMASSSIGWPLCSSFNHQACQSCVLRAQGKGPIHFARRQALTQYVPQPLQAKAGADPLLPEGYYRNINDHVFVKPTKDNDARDVFGHAITDAALDSIDGRLLLQLRIMGTLRWCSIPLNKLTPNGIIDSLYLGSRNTMAILGDPKVVRHCVMAWITHLQRLGRYKHESRFGWDGDNFVVGDQEYTPTGINAAYRSTVGDAIVADYQPKGTMQPWKDAMQLLYGNTALEIIVASAFAAPLVSLVSEFSLFLSIVSHSSGHGKTTAMKCGQAVWGHPIRGVSAVRDTDNAFIAKLDILNNLPAYWDEVKGDEDQEKMVGIVFQVTGNRPKQRLSRDAKLKQIGEYLTMCAVASNTGVLEEVVAKTQGNEAGQVRVFEYEVPPLVNVNPRSNTLMLKLSTNYGCAGAVYAQWLVANKSAVEQILGAIDDQLLAACQFDPKDRFRRFTLVTLLAGAMLANQCGLTSFDISAMQTFLIQALQELKNDASMEVYTLTAPDAAENIIAELIGDLRNVSMIETNIVPRAIMGRPNQQQQAVTEVVPVDRNRVKDVWMQVGDDGRILVRAKSFDDWLRKRKYNPKQVRRLLEKDYRITRRKVGIGVGIWWMASAKSRATCYELDPKVAPPPVSRILSAPGANFGSPGPTKSSS
jgi:hypothetical protein